MSANHLDTFFETLNQSHASGGFIKLTLSDRRNKENDLKSVSVKPVQLKAGLQWQFVHRYPTKDITSNHEPKQALVLLRNLLQTDFYKADLFTTTGDYHLTLTENGSASLKHKSAAEAGLKPETAHDKEKKRHIPAEGNIYLHRLGVTTADGKVKSDKQDKYRQINKYVEIVESIVKQATLPSNFTIADMGAGKGYLTFALYDYLTNTMHLQPEVTGIEIRQELVDSCNQLAEECNFKQLHFRVGSIEAIELPATDMLIALHACDTATDQAIYRGITAGAQIILCAPCCHKQIRQQMHPGNVLHTITDFGILEERQAEIVTDTIRALVLKAFGYKTNVFEFISTEHTPKNLLISAVRTRALKTPRKEVLEEIKSLKALFNIEYHELERLMGIVN